MLLKEFKLVRRVIISEVAIVEAKNLKAAQAIYDSGEVEGWEEEDVSGSEVVGLERIDERGEDGYFKICQEEEK